MILYEVMIIFFEFKEGAFEVNYNNNDIHNTITVRQYLSCWEV